MKISTRGRYGLTAMVDLALHSRGTYISLKNIAERQDISEHYLEQLIALLKKASLVKSVRGAQGGYTLAADANDISVGDILRALEGSLAPVDCVADNAENDEARCTQWDCCVTKDVWQKINNCVNDVVDSIKLSDLAAEQRKIDDHATNSAIMYYI